MIATLRENDADVVYGLRVKRAGETFLKKATAWLFYRLLSLLSGTEIPVDTGDFRVITREVKDALISFNEPKPFLRGLVAWIGFTQIPFEYERQERRLGKTKYSWTRMCRFALNAILSFSSVPLKMAILLGAGGLCISLSFALYALVVWVLGNPVPGWTSLIIGFTFLNSITFLVVGFIGLYIGRVHEALLQRPLYIIRKKIK